MSEADAQRFNLVFTGVLRPGTEPIRARRALAGFFGLHDPDAVETFFSGRPVPLRRNLSRDDAQRLYRQLRELGLICEIPRADAPPPAAPVSGTKPRRRVRALTGEPAPDGARPERANGGNGGTVAAPAQPSSARKQAPVRKRASKPQKASARGTHTAKSATMQGAPSAGAETAGAPATQASGDARPHASIPRGPAPNLFALRPAIVRRPAPEPGEQLRALVAGFAAFALVVVVVAVSLRFPPAPAGPEPRGPLAAASGPDGGLIMLQPQALLLHRRSGLARARVDANALGLASFAPPLLVTADAAVLVGARGDSGDSGDYRLLRCDLTGPSCMEDGGDVTLDGPPALAESYLGDALFLLTRDGRLVRRDDSGVTVADTTLPARMTPRLAYHDGLLFAPAAESPLLGVFRPDPARFGAQIDALLLTAPADDGGPAQRITDIAVGDNARWAILEREDGRGLYRFDRQWGSPQRVAVSVGGNAFLVPWRDRLLVIDPDSGSAARIAPDGQREADLVSQMLADERAEWQSLTRERALLRRVGVILPLAVAALALLYALLQGSATRSLQTAVRGSTAILDPMPANMHWLPAAPRRDQQVARLGVVLTALALLPAGVLLAAGAWLAALTLLPVAVAGLYARGALTRGLGGHLGLRGNEAVVIDHDGRYFYGPRKLLRRGAGFVFAPGVALPVAPPLLPNIAHFDERDAAPLDDVSSTIGTLWQLRHPWMLALLGAAVGGLLSLTAALLTG